MPKAQLKKKGLASRVAGKTPPKPKQLPPVWEGPASDGEQGGTTQSIVGEYIACKERCRLHVIEGLTENDKFKHTIEYGNMWHVCEEALAANILFVRPLTDYCQKLCRKYPLQQEQVNHWYQVCLAQFPRYVDWWKKHPDVKNRTPLLQEEKFKISYPLPSGRVVFLRGKWDSVDLIGKDGLYLQENKTKGDINQDQLKKQLTFDLQTMFYFVALDEAKTVMDFERGVEIQSTLENIPLRGVRYNVVRRPLSGGRHSIRQHQGSKNKAGETSQEFYNRLGGLIETAHGPEAELPIGEHYFFMRWKVEITNHDVERFKREFLDPVLENMLDDYEWWKYNHDEHMHLQYNYLIRAERFPHHQNRHFRLPYGIWNAVAEGVPSELDEYLMSGSTLGLTHTTNLFPELQD